jgi:hypothetical protein
MNPEEQRQRQRGAELILERCRRFAQELNVELKDVHWKDDVQDARNAYTLLVDAGRDVDEIPLSHAEIQAYATGTSTAGTDEKLKSIIEKRPSGS